MRVSIDELQAALDKLKAEGLAGSTIVALSGRDNNGKPGFANFEVVPHVAAVGKAEFEKPWTIAKLVTRGGVPVVLLG